MNLPDIINGLFESLAGIAVLGHVRIILRDRQVKGVSTAACVFFIAWGLWNLFYYPHIGQWWSFAGGIVVVIMNTIWLALIIYYRRRREEAALPTSLCP